MNRNCRSVFFAIFDADRDLNKLFNRTLTFSWSNSCRIDGSFRCCSLRFEKF
jgi:hypothetical protein